MKDNQTIMIHPEVRCQAHKATVATSKSLTIEEEKNDDMKAEKTAVSVEMYLI